MQRALFLVVYVLNNPLVIINVHSAQETTDRGKGG